jgi:HSF-type DNA-binding
MSLDALNQLVEAAKALARAKGKVVEPAVAAMTATPSTTPVVPREIFPKRLMAMLQDDSLNDIISWLPHGKAFVIIRPDVFTDRIWPSSCHL